MTVRHEQGALLSADPGSGQQISKDDYMLDACRQRLRQRGARGIQGLARSFACIDDDNSGSLEAAEFFKAMKDYRITKDPVEQ
jgi:hypothetical protein